MVGDTIPYVPTHHAIVCAVQSYSYGGPPKEIIKNFGACVASPPDLFESTHLERTRFIPTTGAVRDEAERFDTLFNIVRKARRRKAWFSSDGDEDEGDKN